ncbi:hypothetical protein ANN_20710 [Periplaneta americana]|uniref:Uncharacterized protein n=1 Tax=Periplaneta americana TaxID=6978 RepID=A0ABQ8SEG8_PERAM|nr:hypothetical protein ANN_20710 [Periplaneta americana]
MVSLCEGDNEPPGSLKTIYARLNEKMKNFGGMKEGNGSAPRKTFYTQIPSEPDWNQICMEDRELALRHKRGNLD